MVCRTPAAAGAARSTSRRDWKRDWRNTKMPAREGNDGEVGCSGACMGEPPTDSLGGDHSARPWLKTGAVGEGGLHIQMTFSEECFNWDGGLEVLSCWTGAMRRQGGRRYPHWPLTSNDVYPQWCMAINRSVCSHFLNFALVMTEAFSRNVSKLFSKLKLETDNLPQSSFMQEPTEKQLKHPYLVCILFGMPSLHF